jgi:hypothetical protein
MQLTGKLEVIGRIGKNQVDRTLRQTRHDAKAIAADNAFFDERIVGFHSHNLRVRMESVNDSISLETTLDLTGRRSCKDWSTSRIVLYLFFNGSRRQKSEL